MGYYSTIRGAIEFDPPLTWADLQKIDGDPYLLFRFQVDEENIETPDGTLTRKSARRIVPVTDDQVKAYSTEADLSTLVRALPGRTFSGEFRIEGEEAGDVHRVFVRDGKVVDWIARLTWPDGTSELGR